MKTPHEKFLEYYVAVKRPCSNKAGFRIEYVYCKPWKIWGIPAAERKRKTLQLLLYGFTNAFLFALCATRYVAINCIKLVEGHALLSIIALIYELIGILQLVFSGSRITIPTFHDLNRKIRVAAIAHAVFLCGTVSYGCYYAAAGQITDFSPAVLLGYALCAGLSVRIYMAYKTIRFETAPNETTRDDLFERENLEKP